MHNSFPTPTCRPDALSLRQRPRFVPSLLSVAVLLALVRSVDAVNDNHPRAPRIVITASADFPDMVFVLYRINSDDPWGDGVRVDPASAKIVPPDMNEIRDPKTGKLIHKAGGVALTMGTTYAVLAVPQVLAEKTKGKPDPAWLKRSAPGVVRVPGTFRVQFVYQHGAFLHYQLEKADNGVKLTLLNPGALKRPQYRRTSRRGGTKTATDRTSPQSAGGFQSQWSFLWGLLAGGGGVLVLVGGVWCFSQSQRRNLSG